MILNTLKLVFKNDIRLGFLTFVDKHTNFKENVVISRFTTVHKSEFGRFVYIGNNSMINNTQIGSFTSISSNAKIGLGMHPINRVSTSAIFYSNNNDFGTNFSKEKFAFKEEEEVIIGHDVWIGANVTIMSGVKIGDGAVIGAGAVVTKNVKDYEVVGGVPARHIKYRFDSEKIKVLKDSEWWYWDIEKIKDVEIFFSYENFTKECLRNENNSR